MATKKKAGSKAKAKARKTARTRMDQPYDYVVKVVDGRVVIHHLMEARLSRTNLGHQLLERIQQIVDLHFFKVDRPSIVVSSR